MGLGRWALHRGDSREPAKGASGLAFLGLDGWSPRLNSSVRRHEALRLRQSGS